MLAPCDGAGAMRRHTRSITGSAAAQPGSKPWPCGSHPDLPRVALGYQRCRWQRGDGGDVPRRSRQGGKVMITKRRGVLGLIATGLAAMLVPGKGVAARAVGATRTFQGLEGTWVLGTPGVG